MQTLSVLATGAIALTLAACGATTAPPPTPPPERPILSAEDARRARDGELAIYKAESLFDRGDWTQAVESYESGLGILRPFLPADDPLIDGASHNLVIAYTAVGAYAEAIQLGERNLEARIRSSGADSLPVGASHTNLAIALEGSGLLSDAETHYQASLAIHRAGKRQNPVGLAIVLNRMGSYYVELGDYTLSKPLFAESIEIYEATSSLDAQERASRLAEPVNNLAAVLSIEGNYPVAEAQYQRARELLIRAYGTDHPYVAVASGNLALNHIQRRDYAPAERLLNEALRIQRKSFQKPHPDTARTLEHLAHFYTARESYKKAEQTYKEAIQTAQAALGAEHTQVALTRSNLGDLYRRNGRYGLARKHYGLALTQLRKNHGEDDVRVGFILATLSDIERRNGSLAESEALGNQALAIVSRKLPANHPEIAELKADRAYTAWASGDNTRALQRLQAANAAHERSMRVMLGAGSEEQKLGYLEVWETSTDATLTFQQSVLPTSEAAIELAIETVAGRKGRVLEAVSAQREGLLQRLRSEDRERLSRLASVNARIAAASLASGDRARNQAEVDRIEKLLAEKRTLERSLASVSPAFEADVDVSVAQLQRALPADSALIEFVSYRVFDPRAHKLSEDRGERRYAAFALAKSGSPVLSDLGPATTIEKDVLATLKLLANPIQIGSGSIRRKLRNQLRGLRRSLLDPILTQLDGPKHLILSPDGALNLLPFAALYNEQGRPLLEAYSLSYVSSSREILRKRRRSRKSQAPVIVANPDFGAAPAGTPRGKIWISLDGTDDEATAIAKLLPRARVHRGADATEALVRQLDAPAVLHIATHGFFTGASVAGDGLRGAAATRSHQHSALRNPLVQSGLVFANANLQTEDGDDGILTALEVSSMNLVGTELVVLSACETGLGRVEAGEGVFGLRRALAIAGASSQVISLWSVADRTTSDLMIAFYRHLIDGGLGRSEALRQAQLELVNEGHPPYDWAAFIPSGDWRPLSRAARR